MLRKRLVAAMLAMITTLVLAPAPAAEAAPPTRFTRVYFDSPGSDNGTNWSLNAEWVRIKNFSAVTRTLTGWTIRDASGHVFRFPPFRLRPGAIVTVHTGRGTNTGAHLYWRSSSYIWNNTGDRAVLRNKAGVRVDLCGFSGAGSAAYC